MSTDGEGRLPSSGDEATDPPSASGSSAKGKSAWKRLGIFCRKLVDIADGIYKIYVAGAAIVAIVIAIVFGISRVASGNQQQNRPGRAGTSVSPSALPSGISTSPEVPGDSSPAAHTPTPARTPSFDANNYITCGWVDIYSGKGFSFTAGCGQQQLGDSADLRYLGSQILAGSGGQLVESYPPHLGGPISFFNSCIKDAVRLTGFDTETHTPTSSFCYLGRQYRVFAKYMKHNNGYVELSSVYIWRPS